MAPRLEEFDPNYLQQRDEEILATHAPAELALNNPEIAKKEPEEVHLPVVWRNVAIFVFLHLGALYGLYLCFYAKFATLLFCKCLSSSRPSCHLDLQD